MFTSKDIYDVIVVGGGHAGIEAGFASARLGMKTCIFSISLDAVANLPCNPSIGGTAKGHLVREIDALGGEMGKVADKTFIQSRMLNKGKGPAVHSLRAQVDRRNYQMEMKHRIELEPNLDLRQGEIVEVKTDDNNNVKSVVTRTGADCINRNLFKIKNSNRRVFSGERTGRSVSGNRAFKKSAEYRS